MLLDAARMPRNPDAHPPTPYPFISIPRAVEFTEGVYVIADPSVYLGARINHSCTPNVGVEVLDNVEGCGGRPLVVFYALTNILVGKQLGFRYMSDDAEKTNQECACGSKACCGLLYCSEEVCKARVAASREAKKERVK